MQEKYIYFVPHDQTYVKTNKCLDSVFNIMTFSAALEHSQQISCLFHKHLVISPNAESRGRKLNAKLCVEVPLQIL